MTHDTAKIMITNQIYINLIYYLKLYIMYECPNVHK